MNFFEKLKELGKGVGVVKVDECSEVRLDNIGEGIKRLRDEEKLTFWEICERLCDDFNDPLNPLVVIRDCMVPDRRNKAGDRIRAAQVMLEYGKGVREKRLVIDGKIDHELRGMSDAELLVAIAGDKEKLKMLAGVGGGVEKLIGMMSDGVKG